MDDYNTRVLLSKLPPRESAHGAQPVHVVHASAVEAFVREVVEPVESLDEAVYPDVLQVMQQLADADVKSPVSLGDLKSVVLPVALKKEKRVYAKLLRCLNGDDVPIVTPRQLFHAANRERAMAASELGWDSSEAITTFAGYTCGLLLQSVGVSKDVLPAAKCVPSAVKTKINDAWKAVCALQSWHSVV